MGPKDIKLQHYPSPTCVVFIFTALINIKAELQSHRGLSTQNLKHREQLVTELHHISHYITRIVTIYSEWGIKYFEECKFKIITLHTEEGLLSDFMNYLNTHLYESQNQVQRYAKSRNEGRFITFRQNNHTV